MNGNSAGIKETTASTDQSKKMCLHLIRACVCVIEVEVVSLYFYFFNAKTGYKNGFTNKKCCHVSYFGEHFFV